MLPSDPSLPDKGNRDSTVQTGKSTTWGLLTASRDPTGEQVPAGWPCPRTHRGTEGCTVCAQAQALRLVTHHTITALTFQSKGNRIRQR